MIRCISPHSEFPYCHIYTLTLARRSFLVHTLCHARTVRLTTCSPKLYTVPTCDNFFFFSSFFFIIVVETQFGKLFSVWKSSLRVSHEVAWAPWKYLYQKKLRNNFLSDFLKIVGKSKKLEIHKIAKYSSWYLIEKQQPSWELFEIIKFAHNREKGILAIAKKSKSECISGLRHIEKSGE